MPSKLTTPSGGAFRLRFTDYAGLFFDEFAEDSAWIREAAWVRLPPLDGVRTLVVRGYFRLHPEARGIETGFPGLELALNGRPAGVLSPAPAGAWEVRIALPERGAPEHSVLGFSLTGVGTTNALAWLGRKTGLGPLQRFRLQNKNRQVRVGSIGTESGEKIYDFSLRQSPFSRDFARRHAKLGMNIAGFLAADLGVGESARCMVRAAGAAGIPAALVPLKLPCLNSHGDDTYAARFQEDPSHGVTVVHLDPPVARDIDHYHGPGFRKGKYNIAYFAWELPDFPDGWIPAFDYFDEVWCPSDFTREAIALKSPLPVLTMHHSISFPRPKDSLAALRARFGLPAEGFVFLSLFDLNSYAPRKNPEGAIEAFRQSGLGASGATLLVKVQNAARNPAEFAALEAALREVPGARLISETFTREGVYALEAACDAFVSLHRSEGFGLAVAECMALGKPVISTDWSGTREYVTPENGCPVRCRIVTLDRNYGPYGRGSSWAEPDPSHAAEAMRRLATDPALATRLGAAARATIESRFAPAVIGARYRQRLEVIATF